MAERKHKHRYNVYINNAKGKRLGHVWSIKNSTYARERAIIKYPDINPDDLFVQYQPPSPGSIRNKKTNDKYKAMNVRLNLYRVHDDDREKLKEYSDNLLIARGIKE